MILIDGRRVAHDLGARPAHVASSPLGARGWHVPESEGGGRMTRQGIAGDDRNTGSGEDRGAFEQRNDADGLASVRGKE